MVPTIEDIYVAHVETNRGIKEQVRFYDTKGLVSYKNKSSNLFTLLAYKKLRKIMHAHKHSFALPWHP